MRLIPFPAVLLRMFPWHRESEDIPGYFRTYHSTTSVPFLNNYRIAATNYKKDVLLQGNRAMPQMFFSV